jgi:acetyl esterase
MAVDPQIQIVLDLVKKAAYPDYGMLDPVTARQQFEQTAPILDARPVAVHRVEDLTLAGPGGSLLVRCYTPRASDQPLPMLLWFHGGGFVIGSVNSYDAICRQLCLQADCMVLSVDYRLAPEHPFPAAVEDCFAALNWAVVQGAALGGDPKRIALAGDSAGGNLATVCSILARDAGGPELALQCLIYPCTAAEPETASHHRFAEGYILSRQSIQWFYRHYLAHPDGRNDYRYAPLLADDLSGLAPTLLILADHDPLYDEGRAYGERLQAAGNQIEIVDYPGMVHAFYSMSNAVDAAKDALARSARALRTAFGTH